MLQCGITDSEETFKVARNALDEEIKRVKNFVACQLVFVCCQHFTFTDNVFTDSPEIMASPDWTASASGFRKNDVK